MKKTTHKSLRSIISLVVGMALLFGAPLCIADPSQKFIVISDIHFDPFIGCDRHPAPCPLIEQLRSAPAGEWAGIFQKHHYPTTFSYQEDSNPILLRSTMNELKNHQSDSIAYIIVLGDTLAHRFHAKYIAYASNYSGKGSYSDFVQKTMDFIHQQLEETLPNTPIYPVVGNNDSASLDYQTVPYGRFLSAVASISKTDVPDTRFQNTFSYAGFYSTSLSPTQRLIVLNSVLFSSQRPPDIAMDRAADTQLSWLQDQLVIAHQNNQSVLIAMHIPLGLHTFKTTFSSFQISRFGKTFWMPEYNQRMLDILQQSPAPIVGLLVGHTHMDTFQIIDGTMGKPPIPVIFTPSISPIDGNNPGFKIMTLSPDLGLTDFDTYFYPIDHLPNAWQKEYNFNSTYQPDCQSSCQVINGLQKITPDHSTEYGIYKKYFFTSHAVDASHDQWLENYCSIAHVDEQSWESCNQSIFKP